MNDSLVEFLLIVDVVRSTEREARKKKKKITLIILGGIPRIGLCVCLMF